MNLSQIINFVNKNLEIFILTSIVLMILMVVVFILNNMRTAKFIKQYKMLMTGVTNDNLEEIMLKNNQMLQKASINIANLEQSLSNVNSKLISCIRKVGIVRFNAFPDMGSDLSYAIALLDERGNGVVITGLTGRNDSRTYAKPIVEGKSTYQLTDEEKQAIAQALS